jgi:maleate isomerase
MTDVLGYRQKIGLLIPSTNSTVQPETDAMRPAGVTNHISRIGVPNQRFQSDADAEAIVKATWPDLMPALDRLMACNPDRVIMGMAVPCFWGGVSATQDLKARMEAHAGVPVTLPPDALHEALQRLSTKSKIDRLGIISPYFPLADQHVEHWFLEKGYASVVVHGLKAATEDTVVDVSEQAQLEAFRALNDSGVDALVQVGTSMATARLAEGAERFFGKPVLTVNTACYWSALRASGIYDIIEGMGMLTREY